MKESTMRKLQAECLQVMRQKNADYGSKNISETGFEGLAVRLIDKMHRVLNITRKGGEHAVSDETIRATFLDVANYGLIGMALSDGVWEAEETSGMVYLAGPIDAVGGNKDPDATEWREDVTAELHDAGIAVFNPAVAYNLPFGANSENAKALRTINRAAIDACEVVLVGMIKPVLSVGTIREIEYAIQKNKTVYVVASTWYAKAKTYAELKDCLVFDNFFDALATLIQDIGMPVVGSTSND